MERARIIPWRRSGWEYNAKIGGKLAIFVAIPLAVRRIESDSNLAALRARGEMGFGFTPGSAALRDWANKQA